MAQVAPSQNIIEGFLHGLAPVKRLTVSQWADEFRRLSSVSSAESGPWRTSRTPYLEEIMDGLTSTDPVEEIVVMKGAQIGMTEVGLNLVGYCMHIDPCPVMYVLPNIDTAKKFSTMRVDPMIKASPELGKKIKSTRERDGGNKILQKDFPGGTFILVGAESPAGLRSTPARIVILDEVDAYPMDLKGEGSPIDLAKARQRTFSKKKTLSLSTPTIQGMSKIEDAFLTSDQRYYFVPCIHCHHKQILKFTNLVWDKGKYETVRYACEECGGLIEERFKTVMMEKGKGAEWRVTVPQNVTPRKKGYHISSMYSPYGWHSWQTMAREWDEAQGDEPKLKTFVNTSLGETSKETGDKPQWENIYNKRETYKQNTVPEPVCFITAGADIQKDRIEVEIVGWCKGKRSYSIDYRVLLGDTSKDPVWKQLSEILNESWEGEKGISMPIKLMAIDSGYNTSEVYEFCRRYDPSRVIPTKGQDKLAIFVANPRQVDTSRRGQKIGNVKVWNIGVSVIKSELYGWLRLQIEEDGTIPNGYCHFPQYDQQYFRGITAEQLEFKFVKGYRKYEWVKKYERNEPLDCRVYARAAASVIGIDRFKEENYEYLRDSYFVNNNPTPPPPKKRNSFWD